MLIQELIELINYFKLSLATTILKSLAIDDEMDENV